MALLDDFQATGGDEIISAAGKESMRKTNGWLMFSGIIGIIGSSFQLLGNIVSLIQTPGQAIFSMAISGVMLYAAICLLQYGSQMKRYLLSNESSDYSIGLDKLKTYFTIYGIFAIIMAVFAVVISIALFALWGTFMSRVGDGGF